MNLDRILGTSWRRMCAALFASFDFGTWLRLGFVAWLVTFIAGGTSFSFSWTNGAGMDQVKSSLESVDIGLIVAVACLALLVVGVVLLVLMWIGSRAQFLFIDNLIRRRADVVEPWRRFREPGNGFFKIYVWLVSVPVVLILLLVLAGLLFFWGDLVALRAPAWEPLVPWIVTGGVLALFAAVWSAGMLFYREFGVPVMMACGCDARSAISRVWEILRARPGAGFLYLLLRIGMEIVFLLLNVLAVFATCCLGALPYVNSVVTLPLAVFRQSFILECLAELAPEYRLWRDEPPPLAPPPVP